MYYTIVFVHLILSFNFFRYIFERHHYISHIGTDVGSKIKRTTNEFCSNIAYVHGVSFLLSVDGRVEINCNYQQPVCLQNRNSKLSASLCVLLWRTRSLLRNDSIMYIRFFREKRMSKYSPVTDFFCAGIIFQLLRRFYDILQI